MYLKATFKHDEDDLFSGSYDTNKNWGQGVEKLG